MKDCIGVNPHVETELNAMFFMFSFQFFSVVVPSRECFIACKCFSISSREFYWNVYLNLFTLTRAPLLTSLYSLYSDIIFFSRGFNSDSNFSFYVLQVSLMRVTDKEEQIERKRSNNPLNSSWWYREVE